MSIENGIFTSEMLTDELNIDWNFIHSSKTKTDSKININAVPVISKMPKKCQELVIFYKHAKFLFLYGGSNWVILKTSQIIFNFAAEMHKQK